MHVHNNSEKLHLSLEEFAYTCLIGYEYFTLDWHLKGLTSWFVRCLGCHRSGVWTQAPLTRHEFAGTRVLSKELFWLLIWWPIGVWDLALSVLAIGFLGVCANLPVWGKIIITYEAKGSKFHKWKCNFSYVPFCLLKQTRPPVWITVIRNS